MANPEHLDILKQGVDAWNALRTESDFIPDLGGADLRGANLQGADLHKARLRRARLRGANLSGADLHGAYLRRAYLQKANLQKANLRAAYLRRATLTGADLSETQLVGARLSRADLTEVDLTGANLTRANLRGADLREVTLTKAIVVQANLSRSILVGTDLRGADLTGCRVYGVSAWDLRVDENPKQHGLIVTKRGDPEVSVDNLEVAQFVHLLLTGPKLRDAIDTIATKAVLILGRFTDERKAVLDAIRDALRQHGYVPILFDFEKPTSRDLTETVSTLAHLARFIIADITDAKSIPQELERIVPDLPSVPVKPLLLESQREYAMFEHFRRYPWVLEPYFYRDQTSLLATLLDAVIRPAEAKARKLAPR